ncbi:MAG: hypothetical protein IT381_15150 [Deltaproteobacteria bacterium]|nr:hypothetical protein [Deltaproteobacteria bacterium]
MADEKNDWRSKLGEKKPRGVSPDVARKILDLNPKLREEGKDTAWMVGQSASAQQGNKAALAPSPSASPPDSQKAFAAQQAALDKDDARIDTEIKRLQEEKAANKRRTLDELIAWLFENDPELRSPMTQQTMSETKAFLDRIGFSMKVYSDAKKKR